MEQPQVMSLEEWKKIPIAELRSMIEEYGPNMVFPPEMPDRSRSTKNGMRDALMEMKRAESLQWEINYLNEDEETKETEETSGMVLSSAEVSSSAEFADNQGGQPPTKKPKPNTCLSVSFSVFHTQVKVSQDFTLLWDEIVAYNEEIQREDLSPDAIALSLYVEVVQNKVVRVNSLIFVPLQFLSMDGSNEFGLNQLATAGLALFKVLSRSPEHKVDLEKVYVIGQSNQSVAIPERFAVTLPYFVFAFNEAGRSFILANHEAINLDPPKLEKNQFLSLDGTLLVARNDKSNILVRIQDSEFMYRICDAERFDANADLLGPDRMDLNIKKFRDFLVLEKSRIGSNQYAKGSSKYELYSQMAALLEVVSTCEIWNNDQRFLCFLQGNWDSEKPGRVSLSHFLPKSRSLTTDDDLIDSIKKFEQILIVCGSDQWLQVTESIRHRIETEFRIAKFPLQYLVKRVENVLSTVSTIFRTGTAAEFDLGSVAKSVVLLSSRLKNISISMDDYGKWIMHKSSRQSTQTSVDDEFPMSPRPPSASSIVKPKPTITTNTSTSSISTRTPSTNGALAGTISKSHSFCLFQLAHVFEAKKNNGSLFPPCGSGRTGPFTCRNLHISNRKELGGVTEYQRLVETLKAITEPRQVAMRDLVLPKVEVRIVANTTPGSVDPLMINY